MKHKAILGLAFLFILGILAIIMVRPAPAGTHQANDFQLQVVRAYFGDDISLVNDLASWKEPWDVNQAGGYLTIDVTPQEYQALLDMGFRLEVDLALTAQINEVRVPLPGQGGGIPGYACYRTVEETFASANDMVLAYPTLVTWTDIGDSWDKQTGGGPAGYDMMALRLTNQTIPGPKPTLYMFGALHAREYTTAETVTRFAEHMLANYNIDPDITWLLDHHQIDIILQANPDGRKIAETGQLWRRNTNNTDGCPTGNYGVDLNRNFEFYWNTGGSSGDCSNDTFRGASAASEPETQALQDYAYTLFPDQRDDPITSTAPITTTGIFLDVHSYSEEILWSWGFTSDPPPNGTGMETLARKMGYFNGYDATQSLYTTSGSTKDFMYGEFGIPGYTIELGTAFFQSCTVFEDTVYPDNLPMLIYAAKASRYSYITPAGPDTLNPTLTNDTVTAGDIINLTATINDTRYNNSQGTEPSQNIIMAEYYIDTPDWLTGATPLPMTASDGTYNNPIETVEATIDTTGFSNGRHTLFVRGQDAAGNWGAYTALFLNILNPDSAPLIEGYVTDNETGLPLAATVSTANFQTETDPTTGLYQLQVISGTLDITAVSANHAIQTFTVTAADYQTTPQDFALLPLCSPFSDTAENGNIGWTALSPWAISDELAYEGTYAWSDSPAGDYGNNNTAWLRSPLQNMSGYTNVTLSFWHQCNTEASNDFCIVEASDNGGVDWQELARFDGAQSAWALVVLEADLLDNEPDARIRFRISSDASTTADGWHLDNIQLMGDGTGCDVLPPVANFTPSEIIAPAGTPILFTNTSTGTNLTYQWDFDDGTPLSTDTNPTHTFTIPGLYNVTLTTTNPAGTDTHTRTIEIYANNSTFNLHLPIIQGQ